MSFKAIFKITKKMRYTDIYCNAQYPFGTNRTYCFLPCSVQITHLISACLNHPIVCSSEKPQGEESHSCRGSQNGTTGFSLPARIFRSDLVSASSVLVPVECWRDGAKAATEANIVERANTDFMVSSVVFLL